MKGFLDKFGCIMDMSKNMERKLDLSAELYQRIMRDLGVIDGLIIISFRFPVNGKLLELEHEYGPQKDRGKKIDHLKEMNLSVMLRM